VRLVADSLTGIGWVRAYGGTYDAGRTETSGGFGRVRIETRLPYSGVNVTPAASYASVTNAVQLWSALAAPRVAISSIGAASAPAYPSGGQQAEMEVGIVNGTSTVTVEGFNLPVLSKVTVRVTPFTTRKLQEGKFGFMQGGVSSERRLEAQVEDVVREWKRVRAEGKKVIVVAGPVVVHVGAAPTLAAILKAGLIDGLLSGNALAVHDIEVALYGTSLGVELQHGRPAVHGHMHHMRAINTIRRAGSIQNAVQKKVLKNGVMHACVQAKVPFCLAGSIRDDGPLPDTMMDLIEAQAGYAKILEGAGLVVILSSMLHGIGTGNMIAADVLTVCVDIHPAVVSKLADRGSAQSQGIVTDVGAFLSVLAQQLGVTVKG